MSEWSPVANQNAEAGTDTSPETGVVAEHLDLDRIEHDLADVERALERLDSGEYWTDELTGAPIPDAMLAAHPVARRATTR